MSVYKAINAVQAELAKSGIAKDRTNTSGPTYKFRGIDDVYNAVAPLLAKHGLCILPRIIERECVERLTKSGGAIFYVTVAAEFDFVCAEDGSKHTVRTYGEAMDTSDKATNKAMSAAYKYAAFQAFAIPTEGDNDADAHTYDVAPKPTRDVSPDRVAVVRRVADACIAKHAAGDDWGCYDEAITIKDNEEKQLLWDYLHSHSSVRSAIKQMAANDEETKKKMDAAEAAAKAAA
jgi:hypothetical protein